jgi:hypothetical protein
MAGTALNPWQMILTSSGIGGIYYPVTIGPDTNYFVEKIEGLFDFPDIRTSDLPRANATGIFRGRDLAGFKTVTMTVGIKRTTSTLVQNSLQALLMPISVGRGNYSLIYNIPGLGTGAAWGDQRQITFTPRKVRVNHDLHGTGYLSVDMELLCPDPRAYSYDPAAVGPTCYTRTYNLKVPGPITVANMGSAPAPFHVTVTAPHGCPAWTLRDINRTGQITQSANMVPRKGSTAPPIPTVSLDTGARTVRYQNNEGIAGNEPNLYKYITRWDLLEIPPIYGTRLSWTYTGANGSYSNLPGSLTVSLTYSDAWW